MIHPILLLATAVLSPPGGYVPGHYYLHPHYDCPNESLGADVDGDGRVDYIWCGEAAALDLYNLGVAMGWWKGHFVGPLEYERESVDIEGPDDAAAPYDVLELLTNGSPKVARFMVCSLASLSETVHAVLILGAYEKDGTRYFVLDDESNDSVGILYVVPYDVFLHDLNPGVLDVVGPAPAVEAVAQAIAPEVPLTFEVLGSRVGTDEDVITVLDLDGAVLSKFADAVWKEVLKGYPLIVVVSKPFADEPGVERITLARTVEAPVETQPVNRVEPGMDVDPPGLPVVFLTMSAAVLGYEATKDVNSALVALTATIALALYEQATGLRLSLGIAGLVGIGVVAYLLALLQSLIPWPL